MDTSFCTHCSSDFGRILCPLPHYRREVCEGTDSASVSSQSSHPLSCRIGIPFLTNYLISQSNWFSSMAAFSVIYSLPLFYQVVLNLSSAKAGLRLIPISIGASLGSLAYGVIMGRTVCQLHISLIEGKILLAWNDSLCLSTHRSRITRHI